MPEGAGFIWEVCSSTNLTYLLSSKLGNALFAFLVIAAFAFTAFAFTALIGVVFAFFSFFESLVSVEGSDLAFFDGSCPSMLVPDDPDGEEDDCCLRLDAATADKCRARLGAATPTSSPSSYIKLIR